jgi:hypothetical protein
MTKNKFIDPALNSFFMKKTLLSFTCVAALLFANKLNAQLFSPATQYGASN